MAYCKICGEYECKKHSMLMGRVREVKDFSGSSPPEIFVGKWNYPNVYVGILSPEEYGDTRVMSSAEEWHSRGLGIPQIMDFRNKLIYGRTTSNVKKVKVGGKFLGVMKEVAMTHKSVSTEFKLKKPVRKHDERESRAPLITTAGEVERARLQENAKVKKKVDYLVNDTDVKSMGAMVELEKGGIGSSALVKLLSAGLLGLKKNRKMVPTRWSITAVDDGLSKEKLKRIKYYNSIQDFRVFSSEYLGNHYEFLLLPSEFSFEVIEISMKNFGVWHDHESFFARRKYADSVTGAYYANRLALTEYLERIRRQAACVVFREVRPEYYAPLGVGILREASRAAFEGKGEGFDNLGEALGAIDSRLRMDVGHWKEKSVILGDWGKQKKVWDFV
jgi:DNA repair protein NreA